MDILLFWRVLQCPSAICEKDSLSAVRIVYRAQHMCCQLANSQWQCKLYINIFLFIYGFHCLLIFTYFVWFHQQKQQQQQQQQSEKDNSPFPLSPKVSKNAI